VDEWQVEMQEIGRNIGRLRAAEGDPVIIAELEAELRILEALYATAWDVFEEGQLDLVVRESFARLEMGSWTFENVYSYVYERAIELETGTRELSSLVPEVDYLELIRESA
jgi:hypothetical protein